MSHILPIIKVSNDWVWGFRGLSLLSTFRLQKQWSSSVPLLFLRLSEHGQHILFQIPSLAPYPTCHKWQDSSRALFCGHESKQYHKATYSLLMSRFICYRSDLGTYDVRFFLSTGSCLAIQPGACEILQNQKWNRTSFTNWWFHHPEEE